MTVNDTDFRQHMARASATADTNPRDALLVELVQILVDYDRDGGNIDAIDRMIHLARLEKQRRASITDAERLSSKVAHATAQELTFLEGTKLTAELEVVDRGDSEDLYRAMFKKGFTIAGCQIQTLQKGHVITEYHVNTHLLAELATNQDRLQKVAALIAEGKI